MAPLSGTSPDELKRLFQKSADELTDEEQHRLVYLAMLHEYDWKPAKAFLRFLRKGHHQQRFGL